MKLKKNNSNKKNFHFFHWTCFLVFFSIKETQCSFFYNFDIVYYIYFVFFFRKRSFSKVFFSLPSQRKIFIHSQTKVNCWYSLSYLRRKKKTRKKFLVYITEFPVIHVHIIFPLFFMFVLFMYLFSHIRISAIYRNNLHTKTKMLYISRMTVTLQSLFILI